jgi:hypothetical protein
MRPMSMRQMHALCYESGVEFDPGFVPNELVDFAQVITGRPAYEGHTLAQQLYERRLADRARGHQVPDWFSAQDVVWEPWEREAVSAA